MSPAGTLDEAYRWCEEVTRREARNFYYGIRLLPTPKRRALCAVYAAARRIDDIGDGQLPTVDKRRLLDRARADLHRLPDDGGADPVWTALADAARRMPIPLGAFDELIDGCDADIQGRTYPTFDSLVWYCRSVAGSIGRLCLGVYGSSDLARAEPLADALGVALQLTNILRDVREDRLNHRIYLPGEDLTRFGCRLDIVGVDGSARFTDPATSLTSLVYFEADRAEQWYQRGLRLLPMLDGRSAACTAAMSGIYHRLLGRIRAQPLAVTQARVSVPAPQKAYAAARALVRRSA